MRFEALHNVGEYVSGHYLEEVLPGEVKAAAKRWAEQEKAGEPNPRNVLRALRRDFFDARVALEAGAGGQNAASAWEDPSWRKQLEELHDRILEGLGFAPARHLLTVEHSGAECEVPVLFNGGGVVAVECGWAANLDAAMDPAGAGGLPVPVAPGSGREISTGSELALFLFGTENPPRYVLILVGSVLLLADRHAWGEGRHLAVNLETALSRLDTTSGGELDTVAALFGGRALCVPEDGGESPLTVLVDAAHRHAVGVRDDLRRGVQRSVELIAGEVLNRIRDAGVPLDRIDVDPATVAARLTRESLRYLYRILFLLYAEARPDLGVLPATYPEYTEGYGMARLGELVLHPLLDEHARTGFHLYESLDLLFRKVNGGRRPRSVGEHPSSEDEGVRFERLESALFGPDAITLIGWVEVPAEENDHSDGDVKYVDTRLRNECLHQVLRLLMLARGGVKGRGGFISYAQLGISQLGKVYEGLMSYTGSIATEELCEVTKSDTVDSGTWTIPESRANDFQDFLFRREDPWTGEKVVVRHPPGSFVYRLAGRDRETSASYYTIEPLVETTVQLALQQRIAEHDAPVAADDLLRWTICEPALGSGTFLNVAIDQVAHEYLRRRQEELREQIPPEEFDTELRRVKAYVALHNCYGVDLNETAVELAEVSVWLNVMHPGLAAPWFGLHLRRGNSLVGAGRRYYTTDQVRDGRWRKAKDTEPPTEHPLRDGALPNDAVHQFLVPAAGWGSVAGEAEAKRLAPDEAVGLAAWRRAMLSKPKKGEVDRLRALAGRVEYLWDLVVQRIQLSEQKVSRPIAVWGAEPPAGAGAALAEREQIHDDLHRAGGPYWRLKTLMDTWCALWFWPVQAVGLLDGTDASYRSGALAAERAHQVDRSLDAEAPTVQGDLPLPDLPVQGALFGEADAPTTTRPRRTGGRARSHGRRDVIPLAGLADWLDFAEALVGTHDAPEDSLSAEFSSLNELSDVEDELASLMGMDSPFRLDDRFPWLATARQIADEQGFFHWELDFAHVLRAGGFDLQLGNPPWVRPEWDEAEVLAERDPWFVLAKQPPAKTWQARMATVLENPEARGFYLAELAGQSALSAFLSASTIYPLLAGTRPDLYRGFMSRTWDNAGPHGTVGLLHPDTHFGGPREVTLRREAYRRLRVHGDFVNASQRFFPRPVGDTAHFGLHVYGPPGEIGFVHMSWLFDTSVLTGSLSGVAPAHDLVVGTKVGGTWDVRPHRSRVIRVDRNLLAEWSRLTGETDRPAEQARLLYPISTAEQGAIAALSDFPDRLGKAAQISAGYNETTARSTALIGDWVSQPNNWSDVILKGPQFGIATPFFKQPPNLGSTDEPVDLTTLTPDAVPGTSYRPAADLDRYLAAQDRWVDQTLLAEQLASEYAVREARQTVAEARGIDPAEVADYQVEELLRAHARRPYTDFYRLAWRRRIADNTDRSLFAALVPPGATHIDAVHTLALPDNRGTALAAGLWASLPVDFLIRVTGRTDLRVAEVGRMPWPDSEHLLASALLVRTLRLNCLTDAYAPLWAELYDPAWQREMWAVDWPGLLSLNTVTERWSPETPLRTDRARRSALVEIDALVAVWLGLTADQLEAIYRSRFPVLYDYENLMWFEATGRRITQDWHVYGHGQTKEHYQQLVRHLDGEGPPPTGYTPPFHRADRVGEMRRAHEVFSARLREAR